jgi:hypothetical protein
MAYFIAVIFVVLLVGTAALQLIGMRRLSSWLLTLFPAFLCVGCLVDLARGAARIGSSAYQSDLKQLAFCLVFLAISVLEAFRSQWRWLFWLAWVLDALICGVLVYLAFYWQVFS